MPGRVEGKVALVTGAAAQVPPCRCLRRPRAVSRRRSKAGGAWRPDRRRRDARFPSTSATGALGGAVRLERWGRIDVLVNNAGIIRLEDFVAETVEGWNDVIRVDQFGVFLGMKHVIPVMLDQRSGSIINISSNMGIAAIPDYAAYHAAKGAVVLMSRNAAVTYGPMGIRVNTICPGMVWTPMSEGHESNQPIIGVTPLGADQPEELAWRLSSRPTSPGSSRAPSSSWTAATWPVRRRPAGSSPVST